MVQLSHPYMTTGKTIALTRQTFVSNVMSLLFNMLSRLVIALLSRSKHFLISWLQSLSAMILEPKEIKSVTVSIVSLSIFCEMLGPDTIFLVFWILSFKPAFHSSLSLSSTVCSVPLLFLPQVWYLLHIICYCYFSRQSSFQFMFHPAQYFAWGTVHISEISRATIYRLDLLLSQIGTSPLFHNRF